jgi:hypothetical protein
MPLRKANALLCDRQRPNAFARRRENRVATASRIGGRAGSPRPVGEFADIDSSHIEGEEVTTKLHEMVTNGA